MNNNIKRGGLIAAVLLGGLGLAVSAQGASFDCGKAGTKVEHIICDNSEISQLDEELAASYKAALQDQAQAEAIKQTQKQWMKERNGCAEVGCVKLAYETRLASLTVIHTPSDEGATTKQGSSDNSQNEQQYHFQLKKGAGMPVCDAYLKRLNTTDFKKPPFCGRPENDTVEGFALLNRVPLSPVDVHDLFPVIGGFMSLANRVSLNWNDVSVQKNLVETGNDRMTELGQKLVQMEMDKGHAKIWSYKPPIDIDNDGVPDNVEIWHGSVLPGGLGGQACGGMSPFADDALVRQPQIPFVITNDNKWLDVAKTENIFSHPKGGYRFYDKVERKWITSSDFRPIGTSIGIFDYRGKYYFDTFFDSWGDFQGKRRNDPNISNTLGVFLNRDGKTAQICEYRMTENDVQNERGVK